MFSGDFEQQILEWFTAYAYEPHIVYLAIFAVMYASSFGFPLPEEVVIISAGLVAHFASHPELYPPPEGAGSGVSVFSTAGVCFIAVFSSDLLIYGLGRFFGSKLLTQRWFKKFIGPSVLKRTMGWMQKYGFWASGIFRFTPGIRFPGHLVCGMTRVPVMKFIAVDGSAALLSVPTQIILIGVYGETVLKYLKEARYFLIGFAFVFFGFLFVRWLKTRKTLEA